MPLHFSQPKKHRVSPIYLLPNLFTLGAMFAGFYAIIQSINQHFITAGIAILFAMILDSLDGRVARLTHTSSPFGAELDSLSDMISFGIAPSIIIFNWQLHNLGKIGWVVAFLFCACAGLRLARFNTLLDVADKNYFTGIPSPAAAAIVTGYVYMCTKYQLHFHQMVYLGAIITSIAAFTMVSNVKFYSFKEFHFNRKARFRALLGLLLGLILLVTYPDIIVYSFFIVYLLLSYLLWFKNKLMRYKNPHLKLVNPTNK